MTQLTENQKDDCIRFFLKIQTTMPNTKKAAVIRSAYKTICEKANVIQELSHLYDDVRIAPERFLPKKKVVVAPEESILSMIRDDIVIHVKAFVRYYRESRYL
jgi:hypothetical protein